MPPFMSFLPVLFIALAIVAIVFGWQAEKKRRAAFQAWADAHGWSYHHAKDKGWVRRYSFLDRLQQGHSRVAMHRLSGRWGERRAAGFTLRYVTGSGKNAQTHIWSVALLEMERRFPELTIAPENILSRFGQALGFDDIDFESAEFSKAFAVRSDDKKLAYDFCNTGMMEFLLQHRGTVLELEGDTLAVLARKRMKPEDLTPMLDFLVAVRGHMPDYLFRGDGAGLLADGRG